MIVISGHQKIAAQHDIALFSGLWTITTTLGASNSLKNKVIKIFSPFLFIKVGKLYKILAAFSSSPNSKGILFSKIELGKN